MKSKSLKVCKIILFRVELISVRIYIFHLVTIITTIIFVGLIGALKSRGIRERKEIEEKHEEEIQFLLRINEKRRNQLSNILV